MAIQTMDSHRKTEKIQNYYFFHEKVNVNKKGTEKKPANDRDSVDEDEDINMDKFMTVDAVGNVDEESEAAANESGRTCQACYTKNTGAVINNLKLCFTGEAYVELVNVYYCRLCERYLARTNPLEKALGIHCKGPTHKSNFRSKQSEAEKVEKKENIAKEPAEPTENAPMPKENPEENREETSARSPIPEEKTQNGMPEAKQHDQTWDDVFKDIGDAGDTNEAADDQKSQGDDEAQQERFDRLKNISEKTASLENNTNASSLE
ncbi:uncharacterized protein LOC136029087 [Artemia franciscana]|uniref:uncharacterized protein LOC136029087 n=1 Tax=Artemia franciscana TaxID=6661 RepID=UPI0032DAAE8E